MGSGLPIVRNNVSYPVVGTTKYGRGQVVAFGGEKMITECCRKSNRTGDRRHREMLAEDTLARRRSRGVSDPDMDRLIVNVVAWASKYGTKAGKAVLRVADARFVTMAKYVVKQRPETFHTLKEARAPSYYLSLNGFVKGGHENCDVYVIPAYDTAYMLPEVQQAVLDFVARGKGLIFVGPDVMPSEYYAPMRNARRLSHSGQEHAGRGLLQDATDPLYGQAFDPMSITVNYISGAMGLYYSAYISNPGGTLSVAPPSRLQNAEVAAHQLLAYLQGQLTLGEQDLALASYTIDRLGVSLKALPSHASPPPPPPDRSAPPPPAPTAPMSPSTLPASAAAVGCFAEALSARALMPVTLMPADRGNSVASCARAADRYNDNQGGGQGVVFIGLMRSSCMGASVMPVDVVMKSQLDERVCSVLCPGAAGQACGGGINATHVAVSVYRLQ
ncbi:hypothetical protein HYH03_006830 [Edaphochlamys debaryana]|uniref:Uncharacterized protein n=1 Tax=Edaphochlamys debaryana TaxID=47281 RepID=A0A835Y3C0_9CHLO|nr:hypothetical protein HYH03_006830 [Edaphochlamys debaryana]|eukprot:KAG2495225.1 hypothetical protein HYH03_006830 [Edaphochlamys debaryana]